MKIFIPALKDANPFFDEIVNHKYFEFIYGSYKDNISPYDIVMIHWPESMFGWKEPNNEELEEIQEYINFWKKNSKIVSVMHNEHPHFRDSNNFKKLYEIVYGNSHVIVHLAEFSKNKYELIYKNVIHLIIEHPLYLTTIPNSITKVDARKKLGISKNKKIILVFGNLRSEEEEKIMLKSFKKASIKNKILLVPRMKYHFLKNRNKYIRKLIKAYYKINSLYHLNSSFMDNDEVQNYLQAADLVWIVRTKSLNSGNVFLGWTFKKNVIGPGIGNIGCVLKKGGAMVYDPNNISTIVKSLEGSINKEYDKLNTLFIENHDSNNISKKYFELFKSLINE